VNHEKEKAGADSIRSRTAPDNPYSEFPEPNLLIVENAVKPKNVIESELHRNRNGIVSISQVSDRNEGSTWTRMLPAQPVMLCVPRAIQENRAGNGSRCYQRQ